MYVSKLHNRYPLEYFDKNCNSLLCAECKLGEHADHDVADLNVAADAAKGRIEEHEKNVSAYRISHQAYLESISKAINDTKKTSSDLKQAIRHTFHSLRTQLDQRERERELTIDLENLENQKQQELSNLHSEQVTSDNESERYKCTSDYIETVLRYASNWDFLTLEISVQDATEKYLTSLPTDSYGAPATTFNTIGLDKLKSDISEFGSISANGSDQDNATQTDGSHLINDEGK
ncbi:protein wech-like [Haliotis asinina]|uniref:protein wech-like n=1 Tax=Haliotis asinina TaxID=109174 RepID=UPI0035319B89